ncbi:MAG: phenylalanine--tRNA ligase subunit beta [Clostridia bacterium]|nr:phenylalanine--tRNA ligase subunit beta [Clostridia bacterium]
MKAPLSWLKDYVDIDCTPEELESKLFSCGLEVEETVYVGKNIDKIVVCKIIEIEKHPNADKLSVCKVDAGKYGILQIITAATNVFVGAIVPVALDGSTLADGTKINTGNLRGLPSYGMFCSGEELAITDDWYEGASVHGILIFKEDYPLGEEVKKVLELEDVVFDINVTANRPDCQSILGLAREVAAVLDKPLKMPDFTFKTDEKLSTLNTVKVSVKDSDLCPRYISHLVKDVKISESPLWLKRKLFRMGIRSISNIVDITNFVLLELGQPMHAFDLNDIGGNQLIIRRAENGEKIITLDEKEFTLNNDNLVICDATKPVCIAGVMGGLNSEIKDTTKDVLFESAFFARDNIRKTSRSLGQRTDASSRYEKGVDSYTVDLGMKRALHLIDVLDCGKIAADQYDIKVIDDEIKVIDTKISKINAVLGIEIPTEIIKNILSRLNFKTEINGDDIKVFVPQYRTDMESYPDVAEEIIREYGYDKITPTLLKTSSITNGGRNPEQTTVENFKNLLSGFGFNEIITYSFVSEKDFDIFNIEENSPERNFIKIINPIGEDMAVMRTILLPSIVKTVAYNMNRKNYSGRLYELAKTYTPDKNGENKLSSESLKFSFAVFGDDEDFFTAKGVVEGILSAFGVSNNVKYVPCTLSRMHPTRSAFVEINGINVGYFGQVNPVVCEKMDIDKAIYAGEFDYELLKKFFNEKIIFKNLSKFPSVERDLAVLINEDTPCETIINVIKENAGENLIKVSLFDIYRGEQIGSDKKSMAFNLIFRSDERTLNVEEVDEKMNSIVKALNDKLNAELR